MPIIGVPFTVYTLTETDVAGDKTVTTYDNRPTGSSEESVILETQAVLLPDNTTHLVGALVVVQSAPTASDADILSDFRAALPEDAQDHFDDLIQSLP
jgi:hypothetical protein